MDPKKTSQEEAVSAGFRAGYAARQKMVSTAGTTAYIRGEEHALSEEAGDNDPTAKNLPVSLQFQWVMAFENGYRTAAVGLPIPVEYRQAN